MRLAEEVLDRWAPVLGGVELKTGSHGVFEVSVDGEEVFSKARLDRFPDKGEVAKLLGLTTVRQPEFDLGTLAANTLVRRLQPGRALQRAGVRPTSQVAASQ